jgi:hypothetical protein
VFKLILVLCPLLFAISTQDLSTAGFDKLTETQKAEIIKATEAMSKVPDTTKTLVHQVDQWANVGIKIGAALGACAKELNVAVNDFLKTPAGKFTFLMIAWKIMSTDIIHVGGGIIFLLVGVFLSWKFYRNWTAGEITYDKEKVDIFRRPIKYEKRMELSGEEAGAICTILVVAMIISAICIYTM